MLIQNMMRTNEGKNIRNIRFVTSLDLIKCRKKELFLRLPLRARLFPSYHVM